ncbi:alkylation response protein AidB-like acyl-CoA dehydrogenase [Thermocatellispora tengchongensis]|uniref:Alkylation response protein AidB-like acyl-CoA dehydrogenase n=1 Tax=Thermocatellispora tengchongensis TaxID=1073253 RepID=A0A840P5D3_9ACTN|nr:acyl-CoA dehydrogenase [Thermocatellispora tengchongensis]MBB5134878.1 alkylation response protein AidB-like acyl-CoA dehydrogenase [Thermocatellispora tengchongensis]
MGIGLSEEHEALRESVAGWAERNVPAEVVRAAVAAETEERPGFWAGLAEQGLLGLHLPEEHGGSGYGLLEAAVAIEALAERMAPGPLVPTVLASAAIHASDGKARAELLPGLADGTLTGALALGGGLTGVRDEDGVLTVAGTAEFVLGGAVADVLVLPVATDRGEEWVAVDAAAVTVTPVKSLDLVRGVAKVAADGVAVPAERVLDGLGRARVRALAAIVLGAEAAGVASWCVTAAAEYAKVREQFGRPIGQFQGIKHKLARMLVALEQARATVWDATRAEGDELAYAAAVAGLMAPDAAVQCAKDAIQTFGGIGYTFEHDAHLYYRRALTLRALLGSSAEWAGSVAELALSGVSREMEIDLPEEAESLRAELRAEIAEIAKLEGVAQKRALAEGGFVMPHLPRPWGRDAKPLEQVLIHQELRAAKVRLPAMIIGAWVVPSIAVYGTPEQQERFLPATLSGEMMWCQLFSEPGAGSDLASLQMKAEKVEGGWKLNGQKIWTSLAHHAEWGICIARSNPGKPKHDGITYFLVDMKAPGVTVRPLTEMTGENLFNEVFLDDVFVPDDLVVGEVDDGWRVARNTLSNERVSLSSGSGGTGAAVPDLLGLAGRLGRELTPAERLELAHVVAEAHSINALSLRVTLKQLAGTEPGADASVRKLLSTSHAQHVSECAVSLLGTAGVTAADMKLGDAGYWNRAVLATRAMTIYGGTTEVQLNIIGERMLGLPRDPEPGK